MSVSQICDKGHTVLLTDIEASVLKPGFVILEEWIVMRAPSRNDTYVMDMSTAESSKESTCLLSKASESESHQLC